MSNQPVLIFDLGKVLVDFDYSIAAQKIRARSQNPPSAASFFENHAGLLNDPLRIAAALGGLDTLVFSGGVGENAAAIRARLCDGLRFLGIEIDARANAAHADIVSSPTGRVAVHVIHTDEERVIARAVRDLLALDAPGQESPR